MTDALAPSSDPTLAIAERQLAMLAELAEMAMAASRAFTASAIAASKAEAMILGEEWFTPEVGRARACGAKDAAESLQKVSRAVRLTFKLEMTVAEIVRDINAGKITYINGVAAGKDAGEAAGAPAEGPRSLGRSAGGLAGPFSPKETPDRERLDRDSECLVEFDRPDTFHRVAFLDVVDALREDIGVSADRERDEAFRPTLDYEPLEPRPPDAPQSPPPRPPHPPPTIVAPADRC